MINAQKLGRAGGGGSEGVCDAKYDFFLSWHPVRDASFYFIIILSYTRTCYISFFAWLGPFLNPF